MKLYKNFNITKNHRRSIILIGNFDGIHKDEIKNEGIDIVTKRYEVIVNFIQTELKW